MKINDIKELLDVINQSPIDVLKLEKEDFKLYYQRQDAVNMHIDFGSHNDNEYKALTSNEEMLKSDNPSPIENDGFHQIESSMIGTFYSRPTPDTEPFVQIGSVIEKGQPICMLEAMKLLNEVVADVEGEIVEILAKDGEIIEFGQPLFVVKVSS